MHSPMFNPYFNFNSGGLLSNRLREATAMFGRDHAAGLEKQIIYVPCSVSVDESGISEIAPINIPQFDYTGHQYGREVASAATKNYPVHEMHEMNYERILQKPVSSFKSANKDVNPAAETKKSSSTLHQIIETAFIKKAATFTSQANEGEQVKSEDDVNTTKMASSTLGEDGANISLHFAAANNSAKSVESILVHSSGNKNVICARDSNNETALIVAIKHGNFDIIGIFFKAYETHNIELNNDEKQSLFDMAIKTKNITFLNYLFLVAKDPIAEKHEILKKSIKVKSSSAVSYFMNSNEWQDIFRRHPSDTHSPIQLLLHYMPGTAKILFDKCVKENQQKYLNELLDDYPTNSFSIKPLGDALHSLNVAIRTKYEKLFGRGNYTAIKEEHEKTA